MPRSLLNYKLAFDNNSDDKHTRLFSVALAVPGSVFGSPDTGRKGRGTTLIPAVSPFTLHFLPIHTLISTAAIATWWPQAHKIRLIRHTS